MFIIQPFTKTKSHQEIDLRQTKIQVLFSEKPTLLTNVLKWFLNTYSIPADCSIVKATTLMDTPLPTLAIQNQRLWGKSLIRFITSVIYKNDPLLALAIKTQLCHEYQVWQAIIDQAEGYSAGLNSLEVFSEAEYMNMVYNSLQGIKHGLSSLYEKRDPNYRPQLANLINMFIKGLIQTVIERASNSLACLILKSKYLEIYTQAERNLEIYQPNIQPIRVGICQQKVQQIQTKGFTWTWKTLVPFTILSLIYMKYI